MFGDTVTALITHLKTVLPAIHFGTIPPRSADTSGTFNPFATIERTGGTSRDRVVDDAQITVDSWAPKKLDAYDNAQLIRAHVNALEGATVAGVQLYQIREVNGPAPVTDPSSGVVFYRQSFIAGTRGNAV